jgi:hypothetical protein
VKGGKNATRAQKLEQADEAIGVAQRVAENPTFHEFASD